ncbi:iron chelate uptake ABC transporter family permease subunit [Nonomuraea sp. NPDC050310]|uniref:iron chelate uptake ABC transporter family permease subunit n=1 Tax=unclassified Nonomuraea TaxID=2593643 RepID=UPI00340BAED2
MALQPRTGTALPLLVFGVVIVLLGGSMLAGAGRVAPGQVIDYVLGARGDDHLEMVVTTLRLPRTLAGLLVGAALGVAGLLMQAVTRNPLAEPGLLGVNAGAALGVVAGIVFVGAQTGGAYLAWALGGALAATALVLLLGARLAPLKLVLAGAALSATLTGLTTALLVADPLTFDRYRFWVLGSLSGLPMERVLAIAPAVVGGLVMAGLAARPLAALALGDDVAVSLGYRPGRTRWWVTVAVTLLGAAAVAMAGPIGFLGLLAGFVARGVCRGRVGAQLLLAAGTGAAVLLGADILARVVAQPYEAPVSLLVAVLGAPVLIVVARSRAVAAGAPDLSATSRPARRLWRGRSGGHPQAAGLGTGRVGGLRPADTLPVRLGGLSVLVPVRGSVVAVGLALLAAGLALGAIVAGQSAMTAAQALDALYGLGESGQRLLVQEIRLPRIVAGLVAGAALGLSGALTQALARNRLATPDLLGINQGAIIAILLAGLIAPTGTLFGHWWIGPLGAAAAGVAVFAVAGGTGRQGYRFLVTGLALSTIAGSLTQALLAWQGLSAATAVHAWSVGSLAGRDYAVALPVAAGLAVLTPAAVLLSRRLAVLRFGEDVSAALGARPARTRVWLLCLAVALAGLAVGVGGPIAFVALAAPVIAAQLAGPARVPLLGSALAGAALVVAADTAGRVAAGGIEIPVGVVTSILGGPFLLWALLTDRRS